MDTLLFLEAIRVDSASTTEKELEPAAAGTISDNDALLDGFLSNLFENKKSDNSAKGVNEDELLAFLNCFGGPSADIDLCPSFFARSRIFSSRSLLVLRQENIFEFSFSFFFSVFKRLLILASQRTSSDDRITNECLSFVSSLHKKVL